MHQITINKTREGYFVVNIGCQRFFFSTQTGMILEIDEYIKNHNTIDQAYSRFQNREKERCETAVDPVEPERREEQPIQEPQILRNRTFVAGVNAPNPQGTRQTANPLRT